MADVIDLAMGNRHLPAADVIDLARGELTPALRAYVCGGMKGNILTLVDNSNH